MPRRPFTARPLTLILATLTVMVAAYLHAPVLNFGFVWDDHIYTSLRPVNLYFEYWLENGREPFVLSANYFRPAAYATYWLDLTTGSGRAWSFHLTNLLLHLLNIGLVGWLAQAILDREQDDAIPSWLTALAMLLYGLHPALVETVSWISCRFDLLATASVLLLLRTELWSRSAWSWLAVALLFCTALLSKETAIGLLAAWPAWLVATRNHGVMRVRAVHGTTALLAGLGLALLLRWLARGHIWTGGEILATSPSESLGMLALTLGEATRLALLPFGTAGRLHFVSEADVAWVALPVMITAIVVIAWQRLPVARTALAMGSASMLAFIPVSNLVPIPAAAGIFTADRYLTLPLALLAIAVAMGVVHLGPRTKRFALPVLMVWVASAAVTLRPVQAQWQDDVAFWSSAYNRHTDIRLIENNLAAALEGAGRHAEAEVLLTRILAKRPNDAGALHNLARVKIAMLSHAEALTLLERAGSLRPGDANLQVDRAVALAGVGKTDEAIEVLREGILARDPGMRRAHLVLVQLLTAMGRDEAAQAHVTAHPGVFRDQPPERSAGQLAPGG